jgi:hypothetical protein
MTPERVAAEARMNVDSVVKALRKEAARASRRFLDLLISRVRTGVIRLGSVRSMQCGATQQDLGSVSSTG